MKKLNAELRARWEYVRDAYREFSEREYGIVDYFEPRNIMDCSEIGVFYTVLENSETPVQALLNLADMTIDYCTGAHPGEYKVLKSEEFTLDEMVELFSNCAADDFLPEFYELIPDDEF